MYKANPTRYDKMPYNRVGNSGLKLSQLSLGFWQNFGHEKPFEEVKEIVLKAFDSGIPILTSQITTVDLVEVLKAI